jgi:hypothetical protein
MVSSEVQLNGFAFSGYRSFGGALAKIAPLKKINFVIGQNNSGKSNVINFINQQYPLFWSLANGTYRSGSDAKYKFTDLDRPIVSSESNPKIAFPIAKESIDEYLSSKFEDPSVPAFQLAKRIIASCYEADEEFVWFVYGGSSLNKHFELQVDVEEAMSALAQHEWAQVWRTLTHGEQGKIRTHWVPQTLHALAYMPEDCPAVETIPAIRRIGEPNSGKLDHSGEGIIESLARLQNPPVSSRKDREKFSRINTFLQRVLENSSAEIEIPFDRDMILVHMDGKTLPLHSLGTGIHEVIILASAATVLDNSILCVEEPELHLHPALQRKLLKYLASETNNQYLFTTHSAHLMDAVDSEIFHVSLTSEGSAVYRVGNDSEKVRVCKDLGYKASDILQANALIWVERPSDRVYLNYWIRAKRPELIEGVHYSIMFYGGRLFSHISAEVEAVESIADDLIAIRCLNQNTSIVFDSDKPKSHARLTATKQRLKSEFDLGPGFAWVTRGREVENYLDEEALLAVIRRVHPSVDQFVASGQWANLLLYRSKKDGKERTADKVKVARAFVEENEPDFSVLDLSKRIEQLVAFILKANSDEV